MVNEQDAMDSFFGGGVDSEIFDDTEAMRQVTMELLYDDHHANTEPIGETSNIFASILADQSAGTLFNSHDTTTPIAQSTTIPQNISAVNQTIVSAALPVSLATIPEASETGLDNQM